jgi:chromosome segregation protein
MYISKLSLTGFKSFLKKTKIVFDQGVTCIVGPNGCGKTNIVDAIRWVIGEQKSRILRADRNVDMIFNGSESRRPANFAEVSLTIHNVSGKMPIDYSDVLITRRVFRNGDSEYLINKTPCRLKDITDLFIDTGMGANAYSVLELKMVEDILSETPQERRQLFEEAAGINKYHQQRESTLRKLDATKEDLVRVEDIIGEVETKVRSLKRQLRRYKQYQKTSEKLVNAEVKLASRQVYDLRQEQQPLKNKLEEKNTRIEEIDEKIEAESQELTSNRKKFDQVEEKLEQKKARLEEQKNSRNQLESDTRVLKEKQNNIELDIKRLKEEVKELDSNISSAKNRVSESEKEANNIRSKLDQMNAEYEKVADEHKQVEQKHEKVEQELQELQEQRYELVKEVSEITASQNHLKENIQERKKELDEITDKISRAKKKIKDLKNSKEKNVAAIENLQKEIKFQEQELQSEQDKSKELEEKENSLIADKRKLESKLDQLNNKIEFYSNLIQSREGFKPAVKYVLNNIDDFPGIKGALSELIYTDGDYNKAIESYLSEISELIVAESRDAAIRVIDQLKKKDKGKITIIPMDMNLDPSPDHDIKDAEPLAPHVKCSSELKDLKDTIFGDVFLCSDDNFEELLRSGKFDTRVLVTQSGKIYNKGFITGGKESSDNLLIGRHDKLSSFEQKYDELDFELEDLKAELESVQERKKGNSKRIKELTRDIESREKKINEKEKLKNNQENEIYRYETDLKRWNERKVNIKVAIENFQNKLHSDSPGLEKLESQIEELDQNIEIKKDELSSIEDDLNKKNRALQNARVEKVDLKNKLRNATNNKKAAQGSIKKFKRKIDENKKNISEKNRKNKEISKKVQSNTLELEKVKEKLDKYKDEVNNINGKYQNLRKKIQSLNENILTLRQSKEYLSEEIKQLELKLSDFHSREKEIVTVLSKKYEKDIIDPLEESELPELEKAEKKVERLKRKLERIGTVNMEVQDEYEKEAERLSFLQEQRDDLVESRESLNEIIAEIDEVAREKFMSTFEQIKENFQSIFNIFFKGGEADLKLLGDDPLNSKIEIFARPGGKKLRSIRMLSAGEKTLTAIALVFGIYQVKPSPFCILDEVDAPLDDPNTRRFLQMIDSFSDDTQFIIVTHNKITMEAADNLYGVTMSEKGVSQIVSAKMEKEFAGIV